MGKVKRGRGGEGRLASHTTLGPAVTNAKVRSQPPALKKVRGLEPPVPDSDAFGMSQARYHSCQTTNHVNSKY